MADPKTLPANGERASLAHPHTHHSSAIDIVTLAAQIKTAHGVVLASSDPAEPRHGHISGTTRPLPPGQVCAMCEQTFPVPHFCCEVVIYEEGWTEGVHTFLAHGLSADQKAAVHEIVRGHRP